MVQIEVEVKKLEDLKNVAHEAQTADIQSIVTQTGQGVCFYTIQIKYGTLTSGLETYRSYLMISTRSASHSASAWNFCTSDCSTSSRQSAVGVQDPLLINVFLSNPKS